MGLKVGFLSVLPASIDLYIYLRLRLVPYCLVVLKPVAI